MAYQGKFSPENRKPRFENQDAPVQAKRSQTSAPVRQSAPAAKSPAAAPARQAAPVKTTDSARRSAPQKKSRKKSRSNVGSVIFYTVYFFVIAVFCLGLFFAKGWLEDWLVSYEAAQPTTKCQEVFDRYFAEPDWAQLYEMAGIQDTLYEGSDAFVRYMNANGSEPLTYVETSAGLSGGHKYLLKRGEQALGYFTLVDAGPAGSEIPDWQLGEVVLNCKYTESATIEKAKDQTVFINGVALTDDHTIQIGTTLAEKYLENGVHAPEIHTQFISGLMQEPAVTAADAAGNPLEVTYDSESDTYIVQNESNTMTEEEQDRAMGTAKTYALRMIEMVSKNELAKFFDTSSQSYKTIISIDPWMQEWFFRSYEFANESMHGYYRYTDNLFSVHVKLSMFVTRTDDSVKEYTVDHTLFFEKQNGTWKCVNMINVDVSQQIAKVRLTFMYDDQVVSNNFYESGITSLTVPVPSAPEGQVFSGWVREEVDENGNKTLSLVFTPDADGFVTLPTGNALEPMTLYPLFENAVSTEGGN